MHNDQHSTLTSATLSLFGSQLPGESLSEEHRGCDQHAPSVSVCHIAMPVLHRASTKAQRPIWTLNRPRHYPQHLHPLVW